jgi:hypothetical protein
MLRLKSRWTSGSIGLTFSVTTAVTVSLVAG